MACECIRLCITRLIGGEPVTECIELTTPTGTFNGLDYWEFSLFGRLFSLYYSGNWRINLLVELGLQPDSGTLLFTSKATGDCPYNVLFTPLGGTYTGASTSECVDLCVPSQNRTQKQFDAIKLPQIFMEQDRGFKICCDCPMLVLGSPDSETWKTDKTSAWIKLSSPADTASFLLYKDDVLTNYTPTPMAFPNEPNAFYTTINWYDVIQSDGIGCYELKVGYNISGVINEFTWGIYDLKHYSITNALQTARIRVKFNLKQQIEGINFTGANVEDCIRFNGFIGERQPNTEIDNLIYQDRVMKSVIRENLDTYIITTDPLLECFIKALTDLYLLSENEMYISDYNAHNHSYRILDIPVTLEETSEIDYLAAYQRRAKLTALVSLRKKDRRTYY